MTTASRPTPIRHIVRLAGAGLAAVVVAAGLGALPTYRLAGTDGLVAGAVGCAVAWVAGIVGFVPGCLRIDHSSAAAARAFFAGSVIRFMVAAAIGVPVALSGWVQRTPLLLWIALGYLAVLLVDTAIVVRLLRKAEPAQDDDRTSRF